MERAQPPEQNSDEEAQAWLPHGRIGPYVLLTKLAIGGMAEIWLARQSGLKGFERLVVIKKIAEGFSADPEFVEMFLDEARIAAQLNHPNVVQILELGEHSGAYFIAMEYLNGEDLATVARVGTKQKTPLPIPYVVRVLANAAAGLAHAHEKSGLDGQPLGVVHRDVSPPNLILTYDGVVKVVDFGIAKAANRSSHTVGKQVKGKFSYMSPEQSRGAAIDGRSDVFSLGIVLFEMLTWTRLFHFDDPAAAVMAICGDSPIPAPSVRNPKVPPELDAIVLKALSRPVEARYQSARELESDLENWLRRQPDAPSIADVSAYMKALFAKKIEERTRLIESARAGDLTPSQMPQRLFVNTPRSMPGGFDLREVARTEVGLAPAQRRRWLAPVSGAAVALALLLALWAYRSGRAPTPTSLTIATDPPGATISIDGMLKGSAPLVVTGLTLGTHEVAAELKDRAAVHKSVRLDQEGERGDVQLIFPAPVMVAAPLATAAPAPQPRRGLEEPAKPKEVARGRLTLMTTPWTHVYLGGRRLGDTPLVEVPVPAGTLLLRVVNEEKNIKSTIQVDVQPGKLTIKNLRL